MIDKLKKSKLKKLDPIKKGEVRNMFGASGHGVKKTLAAYGYKPEEELMFIARMAMEQWNADPNPKYLQLAMDCNASLLEYTQPKKKAQEVAPEKSRSPEESKKAAEDAYALMQELDNNGPIPRTETESDSNGLGTRSEPLAPEACAKEDLRHDQEHEGTGSCSELQPENREELHDGDVSGRNSQEKS